ncbi:MAG: hypothetical protein K8W52_43225 [Deltaproteobacteria bacterium]|nr:hypothetical protein [Deltaproteobacteria bacterium]
MRGNSLALALLTAALPLAACGSVSSFPDAAGGIDGATNDASPDAVVAGVVKVTVIDPNGGAPVVGAQVVFLQPDGSVASRVATDGVGKAQGEVLPGGSVVSVLIGPNSYSMEQIRAVKPGDDLEMNYFQPYSDNTQLGTFGATWSAYSGATQYGLFGPCGSTNSNASNPLSATLTIYQNCKQNSMDLIAVAYDANFNPLAYLEKPNVPFSPNGATALGNGWQTMKTFNGNFTNLPADVTNVRLTHYAPDGRGWSIQGSATPTGGTESIAVQTVTAATAVVRSEFNNASNSRQQVQAGIAGNSLNYSLDVGGALMKWIDIPTYTGDTGALAVTLSGSSTVVPDGAYVRLGYSRPAAFSAVPGVITNQYDWVILGPEAGPLTLPTLPPEVGDVGPKLGDSVGFSPFVAILEADSLDGYDDFRAGLGNLDALFGEHVTTGTARFSTSPNLR